MTTTPQQARAVARLGAEAVAVTGVVAVLGRAILGPLDGLPAEDRVLVRLAEHGTPRADRTTWVLSTYSDTAATIVTALAAGVCQWRAGRDPGEVVRPAAAISLETAVFVTAAALVGRPRPQVRRLDRAAPTSSFPSGHTAASTALHLTLADLLPGAGRPARATRAALRWLVPPLVGWSRLYRGMHHPSDVAVGLAVGVWAAGAVRRTLAPRHPVGGPGSV